ncbi:peroxiredoxin [Sphingomonas sp. AAP5]|uniref:peroxiredoxin n=1 Tax=unclassified Sphingomonas TaxID=196159 RepID=UPI0010570A3A|nr:MULTISPECIES: peroxiredoxin [unclassified Sphingomonas]MDY7523296.1 peroxiredoxin [Sphingomonas sp. 10B4]MEB0283457.1 peroxiredoxin [Sphingomonas sp. 10B4]QBM76410.1 peroxiredoxin [Sphingomonas sp. AAP5]
MKFAVPLIAAATAALLAAAPASAALKVGDAAPNFSTEAALAGKTHPFSLAAALKKGPVVLYFFPAAFTSGCTAEAHAFAEAADDFTKQGATLIGLTAGNAERIKEFSSVECRDKFPVGLATPATISGYDVALPQKAGWTNRTSYVIGKNGKIAYVLSDMAPAGHITGTLAAVKALKAKKG